MSEKEKKERKGETPAAEGEAPAKGKGGKEGKGKGGKKKGEKSDKVEAGAEQAQSAKPEEPPVPPRLKERYRSEVRAALMKQFGIQNPMAVPGL